MSEITSRKRKLLTKLAKSLGILVTEYPDNFKGSGERVIGASKNNQPFDRRVIKATKRDLEKLEARIRKAEDALELAKRKRDEFLLEKEGGLRSTKKWLAFQYPEKDNPIRKRFEELMEES